MNFVSKYLSCSGEAEGNKYLPSVFTQVPFTFFYCNRFHCQNNYDADVLIHYPCHCFLPKCCHGHHLCNLHSASSLLAGSLIHYAPPLLYHYTPRQASWCLLSLEAPLLLSVLYSAPVRNSVGWTSALFAACFPASQELSPEPLCFLWHPHPSLIFSWAITSPNHYLSLLHNL